MNRILITLVFLITLVGCCYEVDCEQENLNFGVISFLPSEIDTLIFRKYDANSNFQSLKDTMQISNIEVLTPYILGDTVVFLTSNYRSSNIKFQINAGYDYEIFVPGTGKLTRITNILEEKTTRRNCDISDGNKICYNPIINFKVDGQIKSGEVFYIHK